MSVAHHLPGQATCILYARQDLTPECRACRDAMDQDEGLTLTLTLLMLTHCNASNTVLFGVMCHCPRKPAGNEAV